MSRRARTAGRIGAFVALVFLMTGCIKLNMNLGINSDDTVSGTVEFGVQKELLDLTGQNVEDLLGSDAPFPSNAPGVTVEPFDDGEFAGQQFIFEDVPIAEFNSGGFVGGTGATGISGVTGAGDTLNIARQGDTFVVTGVLDLSTGLSGATGPFGGSGGAQFFESADIKIAITFPGAVVQAPGGQIDGNTVTYVPKFGERLEINATGSAVDNGEAADVVGGSDSMLPLILIIAGVVLVLLIIIGLVIRSRRHKGGDAGTTGFGEAGPAAPPDVATPAPGAPTDAHSSGAHTADAAGRTTAATPRPRAEAASLRARPTGAASGGPGQHPSDEDVLRERRPLAAVEPDDRLDRRERARRALDLDDATVQPGGRASAPARCSGPCELERFLAREAVQPLHGRRCKRVGHRHHLGLTCGPTSRGEGARRTAPSIFLDRRPVGRWSRTACGYPAVPVTKHREVRVD